MVSRESQIDQRVKELIVKLVDATIVDKERQELQHLTHERAKRMMPDFSRLRR